MCFEQFLFSVEMSLNKKYEQISRKCDFEFKEQSWCDFINSEKYFQLKCTYTIPKLIYQTAVSTHYTLPVSVVKTISSAWQQ